MKEYMLKRALPFTLTFIIGAAAGGFFQLLAARGGGWFQGRERYSYDGRRGCGKKFRRHHYAFEPARESKAPVILFKPDARWPADYPQSASEYATQLVRVSVTFGDDGRVRAARALDGRTRGAGESAERAAWNIRFLPATVNSVPVTVTEEVTIRVPPSDD